MSFSAHCVCTNPHEIYAQWVTYASDWRVTVFFAIDVCNTLKCGPIVRGVSDLRRTFAIRYERPRKCLVIGATGLVGRALVSKLREHDIRVRALVRPTSNRAIVEAEGVEFVLGDVREPATLEPAMEGVDVVFNLAVPRHQSQENGEVLHRAGDRSVVVDGAMNVAEAAQRAGIGRLVHVGSAGVVGRVRSGTISEESDAKPDRAYRRNRLEAELRLTSFSKEHGLPLVVARLTHVYGPGDVSMEGTFRLISRGQFTLWGDGEQLHHISYVDDVAEGLVAVAKAKLATPELFIIGSRAMQLWSWLQLIADATGGRVRRHAWMGPLLRPASRAYDALGCPGDASLGITKKLDFHVNPIVYDLSKAARELGLPPNVPPEVAVARTADWYRRAGRL